MGAREGAQIFMPNSISWDQMEDQVMGLLGEKFSVIPENFVELGYFVSWISNFLSWNSVVLNIWAEAVYSFDRLWTKKISAFKIITVMFLYIQLFHLT